MKEIVLFPIGHHWSSSYAYIVNLQSVPFRLLPRSNILKNLQMFQLFPIFTLNFCDPFMVNKPYISLKLRASLL
ncbi:hypothetical protein BLOT_006820 [Blomia tropicalis]|nr:hypothetical protein BLOT_006820 [Blomia tropicalis]